MSEPKDQTKPTITNQWNTRTHNTTSEIERLRTSLREIRDCETLEAAKDIALKARTQQVTGMNARGASHSDAELDRQPSTLRKLHFILTFGLIGIPVSWIGFVWTVCRIGWGVGEHAAGQLHDDIVKRPNG